MRGQGTPRAAILALATGLVGCDALTGLYDAYLDPDPGTEGYDPSPPKDYGTPIGEKSHQVTCDPLHGFVVGSSWFAIYDGEERRYDRGEDCTQEWLSESYVQRLDPVAQDSTTGALLHGPGCRVRWTGSVTDFDGASFAALGLVVTMPDLEDYSSLLVETRGDGRVYRVKFPQKKILEEIPEQEDCHTEKLDFHGMDIACGNGSDEWVTQEIPFNSLEQEGWGEAADLDLSDVGQLQLFTKERPIREFQCDVAVVGLRR